MINFRILTYFFPKTLTGIPGHLRGLSEVEEEYEEGFAELIPSLKKIISDLESQAVKDKETIIALTPAGKTRGAGEWSLLKHLFRYNEDPADWNRSREKQYTFMKNLTIDQLLELAQKGAESVQAPQQERSTTSSERGKIFRSAHKSKRAEIENILSDVDNRNIFR